MLQYVDTRNDRWQEDNILLRLIFNLVFVDNNVRLFVLGKMVITLYDVIK